MLKGTRSLRSLFPPGCYEFELHCVCKAPRDGGTPWQTAVPWPLQPKANAQLCHQGSAGPRKTFQDEGQMGQNK